jgi:hypothetical protein
MKSDIDIMNGQLHSLEFDGADMICDLVNKAKADLYYVPSSYHSSETNIFELQVMGKTVKGNLQRSLIRTETGGQEVTYAIELETQKISKRDLAKFTEELMKALQGLEVSDIGGQTPDPSILTLKVINQVL